MNPVGIFERMSPALVGVFLACLALVVYFAVTQTNDDREAWVKKYYQAQDRWLSDCAAMKRPIDDCTLSWSKNDLLRDVYLKKVAP